MEKDTTVKPRSLGASIHTTYTEVQRRTLDRLKIHYPKGHFLVVRTYGFVLGEFHYYVGCVIDHAVGNSVKVIITRSEEYSETPKSGAVDVRDIMDVFDNHDAAVTATGSYNKENSKEN